MSPSKLAAEGKIKVAEHFLSFQGEGSTVGKLSVFLRLSGCALSCAWCDTVEVWRRGTEMSHRDLLNILTNDYGRALVAGAQLVVTGGDPLLQQGMLGTFLDGFTDSYFNTEIELETEGVIMPSDQIDNMVVRFNVSPKTSNSGMSKKARQKDDVIAFHVGNKKSIFKFVVGNEADAGEAMDLIKEFNMDRRDCYFMPLCQTRATQDAVAASVAALALERGVNYSPRMHIQVWDRKTGV